MTLPLRTGSEGTSVDLHALTAWLLGLLVFTIPFEEIVSIPMIGSTTRLVGIVVLPVAVIALATRDRLRIRLPMLFTLVAAAFVVWNLATYFWSYEPAATLRAVFTYAQLLAIVWLIAEFCHERRRMLALMQAFVLGNCVAFVITAYNVFTVTDATFRDIGRFDPNEFATFLALGIPMVAILLAERRGMTLHAINLIYPFIATFGVVLAASRGGLLVCLVALAAIPVAMARLTVVVRVALFAVVVAASWSSFIVAPQLFPDLDRNVERLQTTGEELTGGTLTGRRDIWRQTVTLLQDAPIIGVGSGATRYALTETDLGRGYAVHNAFLSVAAGTGAIGAVLFAGLFVIALVSVAHADRRDRPYHIVLAAALIVSTMPINSEVDKYTWFVLVLLALQRPILIGPAWRSARMGTVVSNGRRELGPPAPGAHPGVARGVRRA
jgi:O-antigen ligase